MSEIPSEVRDLLRERLPSMDHIEVLMRLHDADGPMSGEEIRDASRLGPQTVERSLADLVDCGLATFDAGAQRYALTAGSGQDRAAVDALATMYHQRPVTLVKLVYEQPRAPVRSFADAFRLRGDRKEE